MRGSLRRAGDQLAVQVSVERMATGEPIWSAQFERPAAQMLDIQQQVIEAVCGALVNQLSSEQRAQLRQRPTENEQAWALSQRALRWTDEWTLEAAETAIGQLEEATRLDPKFALAYAALSAAYWGPIQMAQLPVDEALPKARGAVDKALALDPNLSEAWASAGLIAAQFDWEPEKASKTATIVGRDHKRRQMNEDEYYQYQQAVGLAWRRAIEGNMDRLKAASSEEAQKWFADRVERLHQNARQGPSD